MASSIDFAAYCSAGQQASAGQAHQRLVAGLVKCPAQQQILGRIARQRQFGCDEHVGADAGRAFGELGNLADIALQVAHCAIDLSDRDSNVRTHRPDR